MLPCRKERKKSSLSLPIIEGAVGGWAIYSFPLESKILDQNCVELDDVTILSCKYVISTGSKISMPDLLSKNEVSFKTSDDVLDLSEIPEEVVVLGEVVACELAQFLSRGKLSGNLTPKDDHILKEFPFRLQLA